MAQFSDTITGHSQKSHPEEAAPEKGTEIIVSTVTARTRRNRDGQTSNSNLGT